MLKKLLLSVVLVSVSLQAGNDKGWSDTAIAWTKTGFGIAQKHNTNTDVVASAINVVSRTAVVTQLVRAAVAAQKGDMKKAQAILKSKETAAAVAGSVFGFALSTEKVQSFIPGGKTAEGVFKQAEAELAAAKKAHTEAAEDKKEALLPKVTAAEEKVKKAELAKTAAEKVTAAKAALTKAEKALAKSTEATKEQLTADVAKAKTAVTDAITAAAEALAKVK
jgi:hypothetical protein